MSKRSAVEVTGAIELGDLVDQLSSRCNHDALYKFIVALDDAVCDLDFTKRLAAKFAQVVKLETP